MHLNLPRVRFKRCGGTKQDVLREKLAHKAEDFNFTWNRFPVKNLLIDFLLTPIVESTYLDEKLVTTLLFEIQSSAFVLLNI